MKKLLSIILTLTMLFSVTAVLSAPTTASAASKRTKAVKAYKKYLKSHSYLQYFSLVYLDNNNVPELITKSGNIAYIATYKGGKVKDCGAMIYTDYTGGKFKYYKKTGVYRSAYVNSGVLASGYAKVSKGNAKSQVYKMSSNYYMVKGGCAQKVSKLVYVLRAKKITKFKKAKSAKFYCNSGSGRKHCK